jgi:hypothetical protein
MRTESRVFIRQMIWDCFVNAADHVSISESELLASSLAIRVPRRGPSLTPFHKVFPGAAESSISRIGVIRHLESLSYRQQAQNPLV